MKVFAVVVGFYPDSSSLHNMKKMASFFDAVVMVDNTPGCIGRDDLHKDIVVISLGDNLGVAKAINVGLEFSFGEGADVVITFDQDSEITGDMVNHLLCSYRNLCKLTKNVVIGPSFYDTRMGARAPLITLERGRIRKVSSVGEAPVPVAYVISSGMLIPRYVFERVGGMDESLFIDFVDIEWCLRAKLLGVFIYSDPMVIMTHAIGDEPIVLLGRKFPMHSPFRHYYYFRNAVFLMRRSYIPAAWKRQELLKAIPRYMLYSIFTSQRFRHSWMMLKGIYHGISGKPSPSGKPI